MDAFLWSVTLLFVTVCTAVFECSEIKTLFRQCQVTHECARSTTSENPTPVFHSCCDVRGQGRCSHNDNDYVFSFSKISLIRNMRFQLGDKIWSQKGHSNVFCSGHSCKWTQCHWGPEQPLDVELENSQCWQNSKTLPLFCM